MDLPEEEMEEMLKLLESYERSGKAFGDVPEELQELMNNVRRAKGQPTGEAEAAEIHPEAGFVVKTADQDGRKVFINVCHSAQVPAPGGWGATGGAPERVLRALEELQRGDEQTDAEALRFPLSCSDVQPDADKQGAPCAAVDCVVHSDVLAAAQQHRPLKAFLVQLVLDWVGSKHGLQLDPKFKLPKMAYKGPGAVRPQRVRAERRPLVTDVTAEAAAAEPPSFPLATTRRGAAAAAAGPGSKEAAGLGGKEAAGGARAAGGAQVPSSESGGGGWPCDVQCKGRPVTQMVVTLQLPPQPDGGGWRAADVAAEVSGRQLRVRCPLQPLQHAPCVVQLPFAASASGARAALRAGGRSLVATLPYLPLRQWVEQLRAGAPAAFMGLPVDHSAYMELDE